MTTTATHIIMPAGNAPERLARLDHIEAQAFSPLGSTPVVVIDLADMQAIDAAERLTSAGSALVIGLDRDGANLNCPSAGFDILLTGCPGGKAPWVFIEPARMDYEVERIARAVQAAPFAASTLRRVLRINQGLTFADALELESFAYSTLLGGAEFARWLRKRGPAPLPVVRSPPVEVERRNDLVTIWLADPDNRNAMSAPMRDALFNALVNVVEDPSRPQVVLRGRGRCFSTGGQLAEFGTADDLAKAHFIRTARSCALWLQMLGDRAKVLLHGACVGSGLEVPAAAARRYAARDAWFQMPELAMGLIPGAGGTVTVSRAIGRHRACYLMVSGRRIGAELARDWGLVSDIIDP